MSARNGTNRRTRRPTIVAKAPPPLTEDEADAIRTLTELQQALMAVHLGPVNERIGRVLRRVEVRLGLPTGAIGTTHAVDSDTMTVQDRRPAPEPVEAQARATSDTETHRAGEGA